MLLETSSFHLPHCRDTLTIVIVMESLYCPAPSLVRAVPSNSASVPIVGWFVLSTSTEHADTRPMMHMEISNRDGVFVDGRSRRSRYTFTVILFLKQFIYLFSLHQFALYLYSCRHSKSPLLSDACSLLRRCEDANLPSQANAVNASQPTPSPSFHLCSKEGGVLRIPCTRTHGKFIR
jgi:hypothetical protein